MTRKGLELTVGAALAVALTLGGCGRKGPLERPKTAEKQAVEKPSIESDATVRGPNRPFVLDRLIR